MGSCTITNRNIDLESKDVVYYNETSTSSIPTAINADLLGGSSKADLISLIYPIGAVYISASNVNPSQLFGGVWEQIKDVFLLGVGDTYTTVNTTGGEAEHTLTVDEMPSHRHSFVMRANAYTNSSQPAYGDTSGSSTTWTSYTGGGLAHNNMPPYLTVYMWKRIA